MAIILVTGQPGSGKTALVVDMIAHDEQFKGRPLFVMGVPDLKLEHSVAPPVEEWTEYRTAPEDESINLAYFTFPEGALVVIDEAQRVYRPRSVGSKVPPEVAAFETHRHTGVDFILLTQHPGLLDANIRKLIGRHIHIRVTPLGRYKYEWTELGDPESSSSRELAAREKYALPKRAFDLYKSSQLHTKIKVKMPWFVYLFAVAAISAVGLGWYGYNRVTTKTAPAQSEKSVSASSPGHTSDGKPKLNTREYLQEFVPRVQGQAHTAPRYDELTKATDAPWPTGCYISRGSCKCVDQQGNKYKTEEAFCRQIVENGIFKDWGERQPQQQQGNGPQAGGMAAQPTAPRPSAMPVDSPAT